MIKSSNGDVSFISVIIISSNKPGTFFRKVSSTVYHMLNGLKMQCFIRIFPEVLDFLVPLQITEISMDTHATPSFRLNPTNIQKIHDKPKRKKILN